MARRRRNADVEDALISVIALVARVPSLLLLLTVPLLATGMGMMGSNPAGGAAMVVLTLGGGSWFGRWRYTRWRQTLVARAHQRQVMAQRATEIAAYMSMTPRQFEEALAYLCTRDGCHDVRVVGGPGDLGADVVCVAPDGRRLIIQAKRYAFGNNVSGPDVQRFGGTCYAIHGAQIAAVVTTAGYTKQALSYAATVGIQLFDHHALAGWASRTGPAPWML